MKDYLDLVSKTIAFGQDQLNQRTGKACRILVGEQLKFDLRHGFPAVTTKKLAFRGVVGELLGFFRGYTNAAQFRALGCKIWDQNANETPAWLANPARKGTDDLGRIYSAQWTDWRDHRVVKGATARDAHLAKGYEQRLYDGATDEYLMERGINQLEAALRKLLTDPSDRRIIVSAWRPDELDLAALPACHMDYRFVALADLKELHLVMTMRSNDLGLGLPFNLAETALFLEVMARLSGFRSATITVQLANAHIYEDHFDGLNEQRLREPLPLARLVLGPNIRPIQNLADIKGAFERIQPEDIQLGDYASHGPLAAKMPMSV